MALVISLNVQRRDLTGAQRAIVAAKTWIASGDTKDKGRGPKKDIQTVSLSSLAKTFKSSPTSITQARDLLTEAPDLAATPEYTTLDRGNPTVAKIDDLYLCEICLSEFPSNEIRVCPSCATDVCQRCQCGICHGEKPRPIYCSELDALELAEGEIFDPDEPLDPDVANAIAGGDRAEFLPSAAWIRAECRAIQKTWSAADRRRRRVSERGAD